MGGSGATYDYGFRIYNPNIARFLSVDPLTSTYPWYTPYQFAGNRPILCIDLDGLEDLPVNEDTSPVEPNSAAEEIGEQYGDVIVITPRKVNTWTRMFDGVQLALDVVGLIPGLGEIADGANALISLARGNYVDAGLSAAAMIPFVGWGAAGVKIGKNVKKLLKNSDEIIEHVDEAAELVTKQGDEIPIPKSGDEAASIVDDTPSSPKNNDVDTPAKQADDVEVGSYTNTHKSGKKYHGKGTEKRASESATEKAKKYDDPVENTDWTPSKNDREAFKEESRRLENDGGHRNEDNYNKRASPGTNYRKQDGE